MRYIYWWSILTRISGKCEGHNIRVYLQERNEGVVMHEEIGEAEVVALISINLLCWNKFIVFRIRRSIKEKGENSLLD